MPGDAAGTSCACVVLSGQAMGECPPRSPRMRRDYQPAQQRHRHGKVQHTSCVIHSDTAVRGCYSLALLLLLVNSALDPHPGFFG